MCLTIGGCEDVKKKDKCEEVAGGWRKLDKEELQDLYFLPDIVGVINQRG
jgi:hypothetical protein